jgi:hypothetical protein
MVGGSEPATHSGTGINTADIERLSATFRSSLAPAGARVYDRASGDWHAPARGHQTLQVCWLHRDSVLRGVCRRSVQRLFREALRVRDCLR